VELVVALDLPTREENIKLLEELKEFDIWVKVGLRSYIRDGKEFIREIKEINSSFKIFLDLKLYDIPNTMADAGEEIAKLNIDMFNIHASAGVEAMEEVMKRVSKFKKRPLVLAVTALTSFSNESFKEIYNKDIDSKAIEFAKLAYRAGLDGVVSSVYESKAIKENTDSNFLTLTPAIRPFNESSNDQKRVADIETAKREKVDFIVVGRPIYQASNPKEKVIQILNKLNRLNSN
jgi:orotidine-5'-phosphate decarboxylase